jgi:flagellar biosynthesis chaperone FliJ
VKGPQGLASAAEREKRAAERAVQELVAHRRELSARDRVLAEQTSCRNALEQRMHRAREAAATASDVLGLRWAHDHLRALCEEQAGLSQRIAVLRAERAKLARAVAQLERRFREAKVAQRAIGTVLEKHTQAKQRRQELAAEEALDELVRARLHAK